MAKTKSGVSPEMIAAVMRELGSRGGKAGGKRCLDTMTPAQRTERAQKAAQARWGKPKKGKRKKG